MCRGGRATLLSVTVRAHISHVSGQATIGSDLLGTWTWEAARALWLKDKKSARPTAVNVGSSQTRDVETAASCAVSAR